MDRKKKLFYKDLNTLRFLAFVPIFAYFAFFLLDTGENSFVSDASGVMKRIKQNSVDFFFFLSAFLLTAHGLREYKYNKSFSLKAFYIRRIIRILPVFVLLLLFTFLIHPWILQTLQLSPISLPEGKNYLLMSPNYRSSEYSSEEFVYLAVVWTIYMFLQFYAFWGIVMKFFLQSVVYIGYGLIAVGLAARVYRILNGESFEFDTLSMGVPVGIGAITAYAIRENQRLVETMKQISNLTHAGVYATGLIAVTCGYLFLNNSYISAIIPIVTCVFYAYVFIEQTYGKQSLIKFRTFKILGRLGEISYGLIAYSSVIMVLGIISIASLELNLSSLPVQIGFIAGSAISSWIVADISYQYFERPILSIRKEFKKI